MDKIDFEEFRKRFEETHKKSVEKYMLAAQMQRVFEWDKYMAIIPKIKFPKEWDVQLQPPYMTAIVRFVAYDGDESISVYLDGFNTLGIYSPITDKEPTPYWEAYELEDGETFRCAMDETDILINAMKDEFKRRRNKDGQ